MKNLNIKCLYGNQKLSNMPNLNNNNKIKYRKKVGISKLEAVNGCF